MGLLFVIRGEVWGYLEVGDEGTGLALFLCVGDRVGLMIAGCSIINSNSDKHEKTFLPFYFSLRTWDK